MANIQGPPVLRVPGADGGALWAEATASATLSSSLSLGPGEVAMFLVGNGV